MPKKQKIGKVSVVLTANTTKFASGFKRATGIARNFSRSFARISLNVTKVATAGLAAASVAVTQVVRKTASAVDRLAKMSDRLGIATDRLAGLRHAAQLTGVETNQLDIALQRMTRRVAEAAQGSGEAVNALMELGLSAQSLARLSPDRQFAKLADAFKGVGSQSDRVRLAFKLFDSEGVGLVNTLALGSEGLREMQREAGRFGTAISRQGAAKIEAMNDAFARLWETIRGVGIAFTTELAPRLEQFAKIATKFAQVADKVREFTLAWQLFTADVADRTVRAFSRIQLTVSETLRSLLLELRDVVGVFAAGTGDFKLFNDIEAGINRLSRTVAGAKKNLNFTGFTDDLIATRTAAEDSAAAIAIAKAEAAKGLGGGGLKLGPLKGLLEGFNEQITKPLAGAAKSIALQGLQGIQGLLSGTQGAARFTAGARVGIGGSSAGRFNVGGNTEFAAKINTPITERQDKQTKLLQQLVTGGIARVV